MKILAVVSTLDLKYRLGCTPAWWQLLKALHETGNDLTVIPYLGRDIETMWWRTHPNPWRTPGEVYYHLARKLHLDAASGGSGFLDKCVRGTTRAVTRPIWHRYLRKVIAEDDGTEAVIFLNIPLNQIRGIPSHLKREFGVKMVFYDGDMPTILPENVSRRGFMFDYYQGACLEEYDLFLVNSEGVIRTLEERGARNVKTLHYAADPDLFRPLNVPKEYDVAFFGYGSQARERWMTKMITGPSVTTSHSFVVGGGGFDVSLGKAVHLGDIPIDGYAAFSCRANINLNITRESHTGTLASSTARLFELASMGSCIVSCPYKGIDSWFSPGREIVVLTDEDDVANIYRSLLSNDEERLEMGKAARSRVMKDHTYSRRAVEITTHISNAKTETS